MAIKQSRGITIGKGTPQRNEGQNGDITVRSLRKGLKMYVKQANVWHSVDLDIDLKQIATTVNNLERKVKELSTRRNNFPVVDKVMLKQAGGAAAVQIKNDAGKVSFRNSADSADISLKNPKITGALDGTDNNPAIDTSTSNQVKFVSNASAADFLVRIMTTTVPSDGTYDNMLQFGTAVTGKWALGYVTDSETTFRINAGANLNADVLQLTNAGNLTVDGTVTSSAGVCSGTTAASTTASGIVELATSAETNTGTDTSRAVTPDGLDAWEGSGQIETVGEITTGTWNADTLGTGAIPNLPTSKITSGTFDDARIAASNVLQHEGSIDAVGALNSGSITTGFGNIDNGSNSIATTGSLQAGDIRGTTLVRSSGTILATSPELTSAGTSDYSIASTQTLNVSSGSVGTQEYRQILTQLTETDAGGWDKVYLIDQQVGGTSKFSVTNAGTATFAGPVTSNAGTCSGSSFRQIINGGFNYGSTGGTKVYLPMTGYVFERTSTIAGNEYISYVAPYDGYLNQVVVRSEEACGSTVVGLHKSSTGTEVPSSIAAVAVTVDMSADDTAYKFAFSSSNTFSAGDIITISFDPTNDANDTVFTVEFVLDSSEGL